MVWRIPTLCGGIVFYKTKFPLNKIGFVICDKCNEEFYAPKVNFSDECFAILALIMIMTIKDNVSPTNPVLRTTSWRGKS